MPRSDRGGALVQAVILGFLMSLIATYLLRWAFGRYMLVARQQASTVAAAQVEGCLQRFQATYYTQWSQNGTVPTGAYTCAMPVNGVNQTVTIQPALLNAGNYRINVTRDIAVD